MSWLLVTIESCFFVVGVFMSLLVTMVMVTYVLIMRLFFSMWVMLMAVMTLMLLDKDVVVLVLLFGWLSLRWRVLVGWLCAHWLNLSWPVLLTFVQLLMHIRLHFEHKMTLLDVGL